MFKNEYQGGAAVEIFSAQGKDPVAKWKLCGGKSAINKEFDKEVKSFVYSLEGSSQAIQMQMPKDGKMALGLVQRFLVLQLNVSQCKDFSTELVITDLGHLKRRLYLSTVHKEFSATPLHARIPLGLKRNVWCNMCIDLVSFTSELFKGAGFLSLDGITVSASCKLRRIFTMKTEPAGASDGDLYIGGNGPMDSIPRSCQLPPDVHQVIQVMNMERLRLADLKTCPLNSESDQSGSVRVASVARGPKIQPDASHIAFGSRVLGPPPLTGRKNGGLSEGQGQDGRTQDGRTHRSMNMGSVSGAKTNRTAASERHQDHGDWSEKQPGPSSQKNDSVYELAGKPGSLQPRPPKDRASSDKAGSRKLRVHSAGKEKLAPGSDKLLSPRPVDEDRACLEPSKSSPELLSGQSTPVPDLPPSPLPLQDSDSDDSEGESDVDEVSEPQFSVEDVFTFSSRPHSAKRGQGQGLGDQGQGHGETCWTEEAAQAADTYGQQDTGGHRGARPDDDFLASESEEEETSSRFLYQRSSVPPSPGTPGVPPSSTPGIPGSSGLDEDTPPRPPPGSSGFSGSSGADRTFTIERTLTHTDPAGCKTRLAPHTDSQAYKRTLEVPGVVPTRCRSPCQSTRQGQRHSSLGQSGPGGRGGGASQTPDRSSSRTSLSRRSLREIIPRGDATLDKVGEGGAERRHEPVGSSSCDLRLLDSLRMQEEEEEEELHMLASLRREQEEEEEGGGATGLSASQIHQCNVSISTSSDETSTWTHIPMPAKQGHHYQKEMNPLLHSNPREWMDVLSPPIIPPSQKKGKGSEGTGDHRRGPPTRRADGSVNGGNEDEEEYLNLLYDPSLNCYFDPQSGKYYELV
ncbi:protein CFAP20DC [Salvelinus alpinus]|uniref:protein CFAP20DC n=1 Tax=Salvelinus alpinus TaxID=8036 RepID=UPI0039FC335B